MASRLRKKARDLRPKTIQKKEVKMNNICQHQLDQLDTYNCKECREASRIRQLIHLTGYCAQGDIEIKCTGHQTSTGWKPNNGNTIREDLGFGGGIYLTDDDIRYTFADAVSTCPDCIKIRKEELSRQIKDRIKKLEQRSKIIEEWNKPR